MKLIFKEGVYKVGRNIIFRKNKNQIVLIPATVEKDYDWGLLF